MKRIHIGDNGLKNNNKINIEVCCCFYFRRKPVWIKQFGLIFNRSIKCFLRSYQTKLLELGTILVITKLCYLFTLILKEGLPLL